MSESTIKLQNLEKIRRLNNLTVDQLMEKLGRERVTYYKWQRKGAIPSPDVIKLHNIFNVSTDLLLDVKPLMIELPD